MHRQRRRFPHVFVRRERSTRFGRSRETRERARALEVARELVAHVEERRVVERGERPEAVATTIASRARVLGGDDEGVSVRKHAAGVDRAHRREARGDDAGTMVGALFHSFIHPSIHPAALFFLPFFSRWISF